MCQHDRASGRTIYDRLTQHLVFTLVCDECHGEIRRELGPAYKPNFIPSSRPQSV